MCYNKLYKNNEVLNDIDDNKILNDILNNKDFIKTDNIEHHGTTRFAHSLRVQSLYKIST